jgi:hypothetical protein
METNVIGFLVKSVIQIMYGSANRMLKEAHFVSVQSRINLILEFLLKCIIRDSHAWACVAHLSFCFEEI